MEFEPKLFFSQIPLPSGRGGRVLRVFVLGEVSAGTVCCEPQARLWFCGSVRPECRLLCLFCFSVSQGEISTLPKSCAHTQGTQIKPLHTEREEEEEKNVPGCSCLHLVLTTTTPV